MAILLGAPAVRGRLARALAVRLCGHGAMAISDALDVVRAEARSSRGSNESRLAIAGALVCVGAVALASTGASGDAAFGRGLLEALIVGVPIGVGLYALRSPVNASFGIALLAIGFAWSLTALTETSLSVPYTIGRLSTWLIFPCVVYLLLAFPDGRIDKGLDRALLAAVVVIMVVLFFGTAPFVQAFPPKTLWGTCTTDCPDNAVFLLDVQPAVADEGHLRPRMAGGAAVARAVLLDVSPLALGVTVAAAGDGAGVRRRRRARGVPLRAHHRAPARRRGGHRDRAVLGVDVLHRRRVRRIPRRPGVATDAAGASPGPPRLRSAGQR